MRPAYALLLAFNFARNVVLSGLATARLILRPAPPRSGLIRLPYGPLPEGAAAFVGGLMTLTPGTTCVDVDTARREYLLHVLDLDRADVTLRAVERDFLAPMRRLLGAAP